VSPAIRVTAEVKNINKLTAKLKQLDRRTRGAVLAEAVLDGAFINEREAKRLCPVDTGNLKNSIRSEVIEQHHHYAIAETGTNVEYAPHVEFGTEEMAAQPFLRPALDENESRIRRAIAQAVKRQILAVA